jgi:hypothetical protein
VMTHSGRIIPVSSPTSAIPSGWSSELSIRDMLERWVGTDETLRAALKAHSSSSIRHAEEERTRQEYYRLETRRVEYELLREALRGGIHPSQIPQIFACAERTTLQPQNLSPISPVMRHDERPIYSTSSVPSYNRRDLPQIDTTNLPPQQSSRRGTYLAPSARDKYSGPISAPPASMATTSPPPSIFFRHWAPPVSSRTEDIGLRTPREDISHQHGQQIPSPASTRKSPPNSGSQNNGVSPRRSSNGRSRSELGRHHPYLGGNRTGKPIEREGNGEGKSPIDKETLRKAIYEKFGARRDEEKEKEPSVIAERRKDTSSRGDVMALDQLVEAPSQG